MRLYNWASEASPTLGCSIEILRDIYIQLKKKAFKINANIEDVGLNEDLKSMETRNGH